GPGRTARGRSSRATGATPRSDEVRDTEPMVARTEAGEPAAPRRWLGGRQGWSVRTRVLTALTMLSALALLVAGTTAYVLERQRLDDTMRDSLARSSEEFLTLADEGVDPSTGEPFHNVTELLRVAMGRIVPGPNEGM